MNQTHSLVKIILSGIGIFFGIRLIPQIITPISLVIMEDSDLSILMALAWILILGLSLAVLYYLFFFKRSQLAQKIIGKSEPGEPQSQIQWLPIAFRLLCVAAGLKFLMVFIWNTTGIISRYLLYNKDYGNVSRLVGIENIISALAMLAIGVYLLCGAPHFVRWHVKKNLKLGNIQQDI